MSDIRDNPGRRDIRVPRYTPIIFPPPSWDLSEMASHYLGGRGLDATLAALNGWYPTISAGDAVPRIVIPGTLTSNGRFWQARSMVHGAEPRYQSPHVPREGSVILVEPRGVSPDRAVIVEGPMCALAAAGEGWWGIALMGNTPPWYALGGVAELLRTLEVTECRIIEDADSPGTLALVQSFLSSLRTDVSLTVSYPANDLAACTKEQRACLLS